MNLICDQNIISSYAEVSRYLCPGGTACNRCHRHFISFVPANALVVRHRVGQANSALLLMMLLLREVDAPLQLAVMLPWLLLLWMQRWKSYSLRRQCHISEGRLLGRYENETSGVNALDTGWGWWSGTSVGLVDLGHSTTGPIALELQEVWKNGLWSWA